MFATQKNYRGSTGKSIVLVKGIPSAKRVSARGIIPFYLCKSTRAVDLHFANESVNLTHMRHFYYTMCNKTQREIRKTLIF